MWEAGWADARELLRRLGHLCPANQLRHLPHAYDVLRWDRSSHNDFSPRRILEHPRGSTCGLAQRVRLVVATHANQFSIGYPEVDGHKPPVVPTAKLTKPLKSAPEVGDHGHAKHCSENR